MKKLFSVLAVLVIISGCNLPQTEETETPDDANNTNQTEQVEVDTEVETQPEDTEDKPLTEENPMSFNQTDLPQSGEKVAKSPSL